MVAKGALPDIEMAHPFALDAESMTRLGVSWRPSILTATTLCPALWRTHSRTDLIHGESKWPAAHDAGSPAEQPGPLRRQKSPPGLAPLLFREDGGDFGHDVGQHQAAADSL